MQPGIWPALQQIKMMVRMQMMPVKCSLVVHRQQ
jgi:hypothetical protein